MGFFTVVDNIRIIASDSNLIVRVITLLLPSVIIVFVNTCILIQYILNKTVHSNLPLIVQEFFISCLWRLKLYSFNYKRPPFLIIKSKRKKLIFSSYDPDKIIAITHGFGLKEYDSIIPSVQDAWYLWPDRLRWHFYLSAIYITLPFLYIFYTSEYLSQFFGCFLVFSFIYPLVWQLIIFYLANAPVADNLFVHLPIIIDHKWIKGVSLPLVTNKNDLQSKIRKIWLFLCLCSPPIRNRLDIIDWSPSGSPQKAVLYASISDFFNTDQSLRSKEGFARWVFYWCAPVWSAYVSILSLIFIVLQIDPTYKSTLYLSSIFFLFHSIVFIVLEANELNKLAPSNTSHLYKVT